MKHSEFIENKRHGSADFPIQIYRVDEAHPEYNMPLHWHRELEIIRVIKGRLNLYINNTPYTLCPGDIVFVNCKALHRGLPENCLYECIVCDLSMMVKKGNEMYFSFFNPIIDGDLAIQTMLHPDNSRLYAVTNSLFTVLCGEEEHYQLATMSILFGIFENLYKTNSIVQVKRTKRNIGQTTTVTRLVDWIDNNFAEHITLNLLADMAGMSPNYLCRIFKEFTSKTPIEYVNTVRIENVCFEISQGQKNITAAAMANGYNDISYFCKVFKKLKGVSAKKYVSMVK